MFPIVRPVAMKELHHGAMVSIEQPKPKASRLPILHGLSHLPSQRGSIDDLHHLGTPIVFRPKEKAILVA